jgi:16S rRNA (guanine527-N7)-methyltransferase
MARMNDPNEPTRLTMTDWLADIGRRLSLGFSEQQTRLFLTYIGLLREWNEKINLTAVVDDEGIALRHLLDSLTLLPFLAKIKPSSPSGLSLVDVGTGAGFPGLPLKIASSGLQVVLLDSLAKRVKFLDTVITDLKLEGITARHGRAEDLAREAGLREHFDVATARAVASLPVLCEYCLPFVRVGGVFLAMKGQAAEEWDTARRAIKTLGGELSEVCEFDLPETDMKRTILVIRKVAPTPALFPRKAGKPEKEPL